MKWTERESVWPEKSVILVIFFENCNFSMNITERDRILLENIPIY